MHLTVCGVMAATIAAAPVHFVLFRRLFVAGLSPDEMAAKELLCIRG